MAVVFGEWDCQLMSGSEHTLVANSNSSESIVDVVAIHNGEDDCLLSVSHCPEKLSSVVKLSSLYMLPQEIDSLSSSFPFTPACGCGHVGELQYMSPGSRLRLFGFDEAFFGSYKTKSSL
jgi:hypothetical protein